jgi:hypothetical protein
MSKYIREGINMLKLTGESSKSIVVDAIKSYNNARIYSYNEEIISTMDCLYINIDECSVREFCESVYKDIHNLGNEQLPLNMVVIYTNCSDIEDIGILEDYANTLEKENMVVTVVVCSR